jgi:transcriptional regulator with XRE-family HTH domain
MVTGEPTRTRYRADKSRDLERIETARKAAGITVADLAAQAGITERSFYNMRRSGHAFPRTISALAMALRTLRRARAMDGEVFP